MVYYKGEGTVREGEKEREREKGEGEREVYYHLSFHLTLDLIAS